MEREGYEQGGGRGRARSRMDGEGGLRAGWREREG